MEQAVKKYSPFSQILQKDTITPLLIIEDIESGMKYICGNKNHRLYKESKEKNKDREDIDFSHYSQGFLNSLTINQIKV